MNIPNHVAIILDGNRRWARERSLPIIEGHRKGVQALEKIAETAKELGIHVITCWAFSTENWNRSKKEVSALMELFTRSLESFFKKLIKNRIRLIHIGRKDRLPKKLVEIIGKAEQSTKQFKDYFFVIALDYGGRDEILRAAKKISNFQFPISKLDEMNFNQFLDTKDLPYPYPDLVIRTGGEMRTSGFMSWQIAYSELFFSPKYLPDFTQKDLELAIKEYSKRQRRYGK